MANKQQTPQKEFLAGKMMTTFLRQHLGWKQHHNKEKKSWRRAGEGKSHRKVKKGKMIDLVKLDTANHNKKKTVKEKM
eukprot:6147848-Ditylum_brightwellii.AAC.1